MTASGARARAAAGRAVDPARRTVLSGVLFGAGVAASVVDLFLFHLVLQWHHFYDLSTTEVAITADGFFHAFSWGITVAGLFLLADVRRRTQVSWRRWVGALLVGLGGFQLLDWLLLHKVLRLHQIRYDVDLVPYDLAWVASAVFALAIGLVVLRRSRARTGA